MMCLFAGLFVINASFMRFVILFVLEIYRLFFSRGNTRLRVYRESISHIIFSAKCYILFAHRLFIAYIGITNT